MLRELKRIIGYAPTWVILTDDLSIRLGVIVPRVGEVSLLLSKRSSKWYGELIAQKREIEIGENRILDEIQMELLSELVD